MAHRHPPSRRLQKLIGNGLGSSLDFETELPTTKGEALLGADQSKTPARSDFERRPESFLRLPSRGLLPEMRLKPDWPDPPVDAGWQAVCSQVHRHLRPDSIQSGPWITQAHQYLQSLLDCRDDGEHAELAHCLPVVHSAYSLYRNADKFVRGRLEGCLLAGRSFENIATTCTIPAPVVEAYERLFFRVHDKQSHRFYLRFRAFDDKLWEEMVEDDVDLILKRAGFHYRGAVLDSMIRYYSSDWQFPDCLDNLERDQLIEFHKMLTMRVLVLSWVLPPAKIGRAILLNELVEELGQVIDYRRVGADAPTKSPSGLPFASSEQQDTWWGSWRTAAGLAMRTLPANTDGIRDVG